MTLSASPFAIAADRLDPPPEPYADDWEGFLEDRLETFLWSKQRDILQSVHEYQRTAVPACFSSSKSFTAARIACAWMELHPPGTAKVITTATVFRQVRSILWPEIRIAHNVGGLRGRVNQTEWHLDVGGIENIFGQGVSARDPAAFQGAHAEYVLVIIDEADGVGQDIWDAAEGLITTPEDRLLAIGNPWNPTGPFAQSCKPGSGFNVVRISAFDAPSFTGEDVPERLHRLLISKPWVEDKKRRWGIKDPRYISKVLAQFPSDIEGTLIHLLWVEEAQKQSIRKSRPIELGVDVGGDTGGDESVIAIRRGNWARIVWSSHSHDTVEVASQVARTMDETGASIARIDSSGIGKGVYDNLRKQGRPIVPVNNGSKPRDPDFAYLGDELAWSLRARFEDGEIDIAEHDDELAGQLVSRKWHPTLKGKIKLESKDDMRRRGVSSPDRFDALVLAFAPIGSGAAARKDAERANGHKRKKPVMADIMQRGF